MVIFQKLVNGIKTPLPLTKNWKNIESKTFLIQIRMFTNFTSRVRALGGDVLLDHGLTPEPLQVPGQEDAPAAAGVRARQAAPCVKIARRRVKIYPSVGWGGGKTCVEKNLNNCS